jgi:hypothetical protein
MKKRYYWIIGSIVIIIMILLILFLDLCSLLNNNSVSCNQNPFCDWAPIKTGTGRPGGEPEYACCPKLPCKRILAGEESPNACPDSSYVPGWMFWYPERCILVLRS